MKKKGILVITALVVSMLFSSCCMLGINVSMQNKRGDYDYYLYNEDIYLTMGVSYKDGKDYVLDSVDREFLYTFYCVLHNHSYFKKMETPPITIHSLTFTTSKGDTIPYNLYYAYFQNRLGHQNVDTITQTLPIQITWEMDMSHSVSDTEHKPRPAFSLFAMCPKSMDRYRNDRYRYRRKIYVNYDVEVYGKHYVANVSYKRKVKLECFPLLW